jgi:hypothetical protein
VTAPIANYDRITDVVEPSAIPPAHCLFADLVAAGETYSQAAEIAGFARDHGRALARNPAVRLRIQEAIGHPDRARIAAKYWLAVIRTEEALADDKPGFENWRANMTLHLTALDKLARLHGWLVDRKQVSQITARVNVARGDLEAAIRADVERLAPGSLKQLDSGVSDPESLKRIAAGETVSERAHSDTQNSTR